MYFYQLCLLIFRSLVPTRCTEQSQEQCRPHLCAFNFRSALTLWGLNFGAIGTFDACTSARHTYTLLGPLTSRCTSAGRGAGA